MLWLFGRQRARVCVFVGISKCWAAIVVRVGACASQIHTAGCNMSIETMRLGMLWIANQTKPNQQKTQRKKLTPTKHTHALANKIESVMWERTYNGKNAVHLLCDDLRILYLCTQNVMSWFFFRSLALLPPHRSYSVLSPHERSQCINEHKTLLGIFRSKEFGLLTTKRNNVNFVISFLFGALIYHFDYVYHTIFQ